LQEATNGMEFSSLRNLNYNKSDLIKGTIKSSIGHSSIHVSPYISTSISDFKSIRADIRNQLDVPELPT